MGMHRELIGSGFPTKVTLRGGGRPYVVICVEKGGV